MRPRAHEMMYKEGLKKGEDPCALLL
jgi:hypothetical protein